MSALSSLAQFRAVYCSGAFIPNASAVTAVALLFEKVHFPNNIELVRHFVEKYRIDLAPGRTAEEGFRVHVEGGNGEDPFASLTPIQRASAERYLLWTVQFALMNAELFGEVFESEMFPDNEIFEIELTSKGAPGMLNTYSARLQKMSLSGGDDEYFPRLLDQGYVPLVGKYAAGPTLSGPVDQASAKELAALLAIKSVEMMLPRTKPARPQQILEARDRLKDQLPPFWSAMLKASVELKKITRNSATPIELSREATDIVDRMVRPAVIDLAAKLEKERKQRFYRILSPVRSGLRLLIGNPPLTQQQMLTSALVLASDACVSVAENMRTIESLKNEAGLAYLLDLSEVMK